MLKNTILRLPQVQTHSGYARSTIYLRISQGLWTKLIHLGPRSIGWPIGDVVALNDARIAGYSDEAIRLLVKALEENRQYVSPTMSIKTKIKIKI